MKRSMQGVLFVQDGWEVILTDSEARARAVRPIRARIERASADLAAAHLELAEFHHRHCDPSRPIASCGVCMGWS